MTLSQGRPIRLRSLALSGLLVLASLGGCSTVEGKAVGEGPQIEPTVEEEPPPPEPDVLWPLTGVAVDADEAEFGPVLSVKIENSVGARPQGGLERADVVWEQLVEGGMTRFVAMYHSDIPETLGPIRSVRPMDAAITAPVGGVLAFSGGQPEYRARIQEAGVTLAFDDGGDPGFFRNPERRGDHNLFGYAEQFLAQAEGQDAPPELFEFPEEGEEPSAAGGEEVERIDVRFPASQPSWEWNGDVWQRSESGVEAKAESGDRLEVENVIVVRVEIRDTGRRDAAGSMVPETVLTGEGAASVFSQGSMIEATWEKGDAGSPLTLVDGEGDPIVLAPGKTWVELLPSSGSLDAS